MKRENDMANEAHRDSNIGSKLGINDSDWRVATTTLSDLNVIVATRRRNVFGLKFYQYCSRYAPLKALKDSMRWGRWSQFVTSKFFFQNI